MRIVSEKAQQEAAEKLVASLNKMDGVESSLDIRTSGTQNRPIVNASVSPENWRKVAEQLKEKHLVDHCSMITGIHWPESSDKKWEVVYHFLRTGIRDPVIEEGLVIPNIVDFSEVKGKNVPLEIQGVEKSLLNPRENWDNTLEYDQAADKLVKLFAKNLENHMSISLEKNLSMSNLSL